MAISDLTANEIADFARKTNSFEEFQTACRLELERREYFNDGGKWRVGMTATSVSVKKEKPHPVYYWIATALLIAFAGGIFWGIITIIDLVKGLFS